MAEPLGELADLLEEEAALLRRGDLSGLDALAARKEQLADALEGAWAVSPPPREALAALAAAAARNAALLAAAGEGLRAARRRFAALCAAAAGLDTYDGAGRLRTLPRPAAPRLERRA